MTVNITLNKQAFAKPYFPISSQGLMYFAKSVETFLSDLLSGNEVWERQLFTAPTAKTITSGTLATPTQLLHTVTSESSTSDDLDTIPAFNNTGLILKATTGHTITIRSGYGNIKTLTGSPVVLSGNKIARLWCQGGQWSVAATRNTQNNISATNDPMSYDDIGDGYSTGSLWINTTLDRVWLCTNATTSRAIWSLLTPLKNGYGVRSAGEVNLKAIGSPIVSHSGTSAVANDSTDTWNSITTAASLNALANVWTGGGLGFVRSGFNVIAEWVFKTGASVANIRIWSGFGADSGGPADNLDTLASNNEFIGFRYSTAAGDTGFRPVLHNGTSQTTGTAIPVAIAANTEYRFRLRFEPLNNRAFFSVNEWPESIESTNWPASAKDLGWTTFLYTLDANAKAFIFSQIKVGW